MTPPRWVGGGGGVERVEGQRHTPNSTRVMVVSDGPGLFPPPPTPEGRKGYPVLQRNTNVEGAIRFSGTAVA